MFMIAVWLILNFSVVFFITVNQTCIKYQNIGFPVNISKVSFSAFIQNGNFYIHPSYTKLLFILHWFTRSGTRQYLHNIIILSLYM